MNLRRAVYVVAGVLAFAGAGAASAQAVAPWGPAGVPARVAGPGAVTRPSSDHIIRPRATICRNQAWTSGNGRAALRMQEDGNFVLYKDGRPVWQAPNTWSRGNCAVFQEDGNFVVYDSSGNPVWAADTWHKGAYLAVQDDGNVVVYDNAGRPVWATNTGD
ncbi:hypothetical protein GCM10010300_86130 [Streptomyces olivaceoviridis]|uniref:hypothetical protein n=1 Tax=Streptomyces olivaceoviridis TaxID=1921 RepID=UPI00167A1C07|nr:hypothetical protein [Streptomyces olivaceoviridis]GGZ30108.1 hypothetical protein GCM10010300_86130 [Streptomyces olivaceoviridis]